MTTMIGGSPESALEAISDSGSNKVKVAITDMDGVLRGKFIHIDKFRSAVSSGFGFCNVVLGWDSSDVCYDNVSYTGWHTGYPDETVKLDLATCRRIPWDEHNWFVLGDFVDPNGDGLEICPRNVLKRIVGRAESLGYRPRIGCEFEWFNFNETPSSLEEKRFQMMQPITTGMYGYSLLRSGMRREFFNSLIDLMDEYEVPLEGLHTETGPGVYEAAICNSGALEAADRAVLFKSGTKEIAHIFGIVSTFMARWNPDLPGTSGHLHQSLEDVESGKNLFFDETDEHRMSDIFRSYVAGQLRFLPEILVMMAPTVNSYKRLVEGFWAPTRSNWSIDNRTCALRVIPGSVKSTRVEVRVPGADLNPYLGIAASVAAGIYGVEKGLKLDQEPISGNGYNDRDSPELPSTLWEATHKFQDSEFANEVFGEAFVSHFAATRDWEHRQYQKQVTDWELKRYFEII